MKNEYTEKDISVMEQMDHIRHAPGMYIGSVDTPTHLLYEILDNALDEATAGYAKVIGIEIDDKTGIVKLADNGRGIPYKNDTINTICTKLFSGGKFKKSDKNAYGIACFHGDTKIIKYNKFWKNSSITFKELVDSGKDIKVITQDENKQYHIEKAIMPSITGYEKEMIRVNLSNGKFEICTLDHKWKMSNGRYKEAQHLKPNDMLAHCREYNKNTILSRIKKFFGIRGKVCKLIEFDRSVLCVTSIIHITYPEHIPVYDLHTPLNHNFALESAAIVHNSGLHGVGIVAVNALSEWMEVEVYRDNKYIKYRFEGGDAVDKKIINCNKKPPFSTQITFKPSDKIFKSSKFDIKKIYNRLNIASMHISTLRTLFIINGERKLIDCNFKQYFEEIVVSEEDKETSNLIHLKSKIKDEKIEIILKWAYNSKMAPLNMGSVNLLAVDRGTHINKCNEMIRDVLYDFVLKEKRKINKNDLTMGLRCFISLMLYKPSYEGQTKEKLTTDKKDMNPLYDSISIKLKDYLIKHPDIKDEVFGNIESFRRRMSAATSITKSDGKLATRLNTSTDSKLKDCSSTDPNKCELFIVEGSSAAGSLIQCRNPKYHAIMALKGKLMNVATSGKEYFKNKEISELLSAIGAGIEDDCDISKINYNKINILTDADSDGGHITCLLLILFQKVVPDIIKGGYLNLVQMPLYGGTIKSKFMPLYTNEEINKFTATYPNIHLTRFKGLGEMNPEQLKICAIDKTNRRLRTVLPSDNPQDIYDIMTKAERKRQLV